MVRRIQGLQSSCYILSTETGVCLTDCLPTCLIKLFAEQITHSVD